MAEDPDRREPLSEEEMRGLLGEDPGNGSSQEPPPEREGRDLRVLVVSRDEDQIQALRGVLGSLQIEVATVKNPFSALDRLRLRRYSGVISDFDLWAEKGKLLFGRLASSGSPAPVVFICGSPEEAADARRSGAAEVVRRPIQPADLVRAVEAFRPLPERRPSPEPPVPPSPPRPASAAPGGLSREPSPGDELPWLRFFFESRRAVREARSPAERLTAILACFAREIDPRPCGLGIASEEGWWILSRPGSRDALARIGLALAEEPPGDLRGVPAGEGGDAVAGPADPLVTRWKAGGHPAVFVALHPPGSVPEKFRSELAALLAEAERSPAVEGAPPRDDPRGR